MLIYRCDGQTPASVSDSGVLELRAGHTITFELTSGGHWYGHGFSHAQPYPLESGSVVNPSFAVNNIQCPIWMCSAGYAIFVDTVAPLDIRLNENGDGQLRISCHGETIPIRVFRGRHLPEVRANLLSHLGWPNPAPPARVLGDCIFCTWTQYPRCLTQERVLDMAQQIRARGYPCTRLIIDDRWESCFGELEFAGEFPDPGQLVSELHSLGFDVWLWVTPFVNQEARCFTGLSERRILVSRRDGPGAALLRWWGGTAGLVDLTAPRGRDWFREKLRHLQTVYGIDGFKVDGGDFKYQPALDGAAWRDYRGASGYADALLELVEEIAPHACETRTAWLSQKRSLLWREGGKDSHWGLDNGLQAMVTLGLHLGLLGYDLLIPDMVPGRVQTMVSDTPLPTDELMVRWTEASAFFPMLQFSYFPWNYGDETATAVLGYARVHKALEPYLAEQSEARQAPLLRPIWYDTPTASELYPIADEFLLGADLLAAPVLEPGVTGRDVLLPPGDWLDAWTGSRLCGGWLRSCPAPCPGIPLFVRAHRTDLGAILAAELARIRRGTVSPGVTTTHYQAGLDRNLSVTG